MNKTYEGYLQSVEQCLSRVLCLHDVPGIQPEHPEIEFPTSSELKLEDIIIERNASECCFIEPTINSARISLRIRQTDDLERWLTRKWILFLTQAAYAEVARRVCQNIAYCKCLSFSSCCPLLQYTGSSIPKVVLSRQTSKECSLKLDLKISCYILSSC